MPDTATPVQPHIHPDVIELAELERPSWDAISAGIPAWHPRGEGDADGGGDAGDGGEGQGGETATIEGDAGSGLYDLDSAPDEYRPFLEAELKKIEGNVTKRFQEAAELREKFAPLEELGIADVPAEDLKELLELREIASDPETFKRWWQAVGEHMKFTAAEGGDEGDDDPEGEGDVDLEEIVQQRVEEALAPFKELFATKEEEERVTAELETIETQLRELEEKHGEFDHDAVAQLALAYADDDDAIAKGYADYVRITGGAERSLLEKKNGQPTETVDGGQPATTPEPIKSFDQASRAAKERLRAG